MSFLESIQHGLEKASKEAARITKIHHLNNVVNDLSFKSAQDGQALIARALDLYRSGQLPQGELAEICQQIITYQQQISEVQEEIQKLHDEQEDPPAPPAPPDYAAYPPAPPAPAYPAGNAAAGYPPYAAPPAGYPPYQPAPQVYAPAPAASSEVPTKPGTAPVEKKASHSSSEAPTKPPAKHKSKESDDEPKAKAEEARGSYEDGVLPPIHSPFANKAAEEEQSKKAEK